MDRTTNTDTDPVVPRDDVMCEAIVNACHHLRKQGYKHSTDMWGEKEAAICREFLPSAFRYLGTDYIRGCADRFRKNGKLPSAGGPKRKKYEPPRGSYAEYLLTRHWIVFREQVLKYWNWSCCLCCSPKKLEVHHRTYERIGSEKLTDCVVLCSTCHRKVHGKMADGNLAWYD